MSKIKAVRGMNDILPAQSAIWQHLEQLMTGLFQAYGYSEIRFPLIEQTELFKRSIGEVTDIVEKEMYTFPDRNNESMTLRPEGTAGCVRAAEQNGLLRNQVQRLWYQGPMFRYERPQKGRQRQFQQLGVECFGLAGPDIDAEIIAMTQRMWRELGLDSVLELELNSLGSSEDRAAYRKALVDYLKARSDQLDEDSLRRLDSNPLRVLDSKNPQTRALLEEAPTLTSFLGDASRQHFEQLQELLQGAGVEYRLNPQLVRGLDYYNNTVFEWTTEQLGAQGTVCGGGRYDGLVEQLGGAATPAVGFALGMERLALLYDAHGSRPAGLGQHIDVYFVVVGEGLGVQALGLAESLREAIPGLGLQLHAGGGSFKSQMKKADKSGAAYALLLGEDEAAAGVLTLKALRGQDDGQQTLAVEQIIEKMPALLADT